MKPEFYTESTEITEEEHGDRRQGEHKAAPIAYPASGPRSAVPAFTRICVDLWLICSALLPRVSLSRSEEPAMPKALYLNHVTLIVDNLEKAAAFYEQELGLEPLPAYKFDYPAAFFRINDTQQLHVTEWKDTPSFRGHACLRVDDFAGAFRRFKELRIIDTSPWGKVRKLPDGTLQMFIRDPAGNLVELSSPPGACADESFLADAELCEQAPGAYVSGRADARGPQSDTASLYHTQKARE